MRSVRISIFKRLFGKVEAGQQAATAVGAFGKHPAWADHVEFLGTPDETLVRFQGALYQRGIAGNVESGAWDRLDASQRVEGFDHALVWWLGERMVVARLWSSVDGKGRGKYPMVACVNAPTATPESTLARALELLEGLKGEIQRAGTQDEVRRAVERAGVEARALDAFSSSREGGGGATATLRGPAIAELARVVNAPDEPQAFARAMYAMARETPRGCRCAEPAGGLPSLWSGGRTGSQPAGGAGGTSGDGGTGAAWGAEGSSRAVTVRLPAGWPDAARSLGGWLAVVLTQLRPGCGPGGVGPYMLIASSSAKDRSGGWVDLIVGEPQAQSLLGLSASDAVVPISSRVPYTLEPEFMTRIDQLVSTAEGRAHVDVAVSAPRSGRLFAGKARMVLLAGLAAAVVGVAGPAARSAAMAVQPAERDPSRSGVQYNTLLEQFRDSLAAPDMDDDRARELVTRFITDVGALPGGVLYLREVDEFVDSLREALAVADGTRAPADAGRIGPGVLSGTKHEVLSAERVRFSLPVSTGRMSLEFFKVTIPGRAAPVWMGTTEVTAEQFSEIVRSFGSWEDLHRLMPAFRQDEDERQGPRVWRWQWTRRAGAADSVAMGLEAAAEWLRRSELAGAGDMYASGMDPGRPAMTMPMQHIPPDAALYVAQLVRCRLVTREEWGAAWELHRGGFEPKSANLRDATWGAHRDHLAARGAVGRRLPSADAGAFVPTLETDTDRQVWDSNDGVLWLSPADGGAEGGVGGIAGSLAGNVAEFVVELPVDADLTSARSIRAALDANPRAVFVAGCSAIGPAGDPGKAVAAVLSEAREGYADVGFRLAFSGVGEGPDSLVRRLTSLMDPLPLLRRSP